MPDPGQPSAKQMIGDFLPKMVSFTDETLFGDSGHVARARENGLTDEPLNEVIVHLAFYGGWPGAMSAVSVVKNVLNS